MLTKEEHESLLRRIAETGGATPEMLEDIQKLRDEYDEREGMLKRYGETRDGENVSRETSEDSKETDSEDVNWRDKYEEIRKQYVERFFSTPEQSDEAQEKEEKNESEEITIDDLFKKKEGE